MTVSSRKVSILLLFYGVVPHYEYLVRRRLIVKSGDSGKLLLNQIWARRRARICFCLLWMLDEGSDCSVRERVAFIISRVQGIVPSLRSVP